MLRVVTLALLLWLAPVGTLVAQEPAEQGKQYFMSNGCYGCHAVGRMGTPIGPDLSHVGAKYSLRGFHDTLLANGTVPLWLPRALLLGEQNGEMIE